MNRTTKINILAYASEPDKNYKYEGDIVDYKGMHFTELSGRHSVLERPFSFAICREKGIS